MTCCSACRDAADPRTASCVAGAASAAPEAEQDPGHACRPGLPAGPALPPPPGPQGHRREAHGPAAAAAQVGPAPPPGRGCAGRLCRLLPGIAPGPGHSVRLRTATHSRCHHLISAADCLVEMFRGLCCGNDLDVATIHEDLDQRICCSQQMQTCVLAFKCMVLASSTTLTMI